KRSAARVLAQRRPDVESARIDERGVDVAQRVLYRLRLDDALDAIQRGVPDALGLLIGVNVVPGESPHDLSFHDPSPKNSQVTGARGRTAGPLLRLCNQLARGVAFPLRKQV